MPDSQRKPLISRANIVFIHDIVLAAISFPLSLFIRLTYNFDTYFPEGYLAGSTIIFTVIAAIVFRTQKMYKGLWRYSSVNDLIAIIKAVTFTLLIFMTVMFLSHRLIAFPRSALIINWFVLTAMLGAPRLFYRTLKDHRQSIKANKNKAERIPVILIGTGKEADLFIRATKHDIDSIYNAVAILSKKPKSVGCQIMNVDVMGTLDNLTSVVKELNRKDLHPQRIILTNENLTGKEVDKLLDEAHALGLGISRLPRPDALKSGSFGDSKVEIQPIALEDLLQRPQTIPDRADVSELISGKRIMITGAGGSIGSELVRQIATLSPTHICLYENSEFNLYSIDMEMAQLSPDISRNPVLGDIRDKERLLDTVKNEKPDIIFHAAALKHVPMVESNPIEGAMTNAIGTKILADICVELGVAAMVMISTDKAVNPTNVMGATKRIAESYCQALDMQNTKTRFVTVRFGNVLGSTGSVVPLFQKQLAAGGPLTVTHPDVTRYFMTIREAVELVLQAATLPKQEEQLAETQENPEAIAIKGKICVLEMGEPVKIANLARQVIRLAGLQPDKDIKIEFTGLRPGEKLFEEIFHGSEELKPSKREGILLASPRITDIEELKSALEELQKQCALQDRAHVIEIIKKLVPEYGV